jgi:alcohol dehydrogenase (cytochrome c)
MLCLAAPLLLLGAPQTPEEGLFTAEQAQQGKALYAQRCAACHGSALEGGTAAPLAGPAFARGWQGNDFVGQWHEKPTLDDFWFILSTTMPPGQVRSLTAADHAAIFAYVLQQNGYKSGQTALTPNSPRLREFPIVSYAAASQEQTAAAAPLRISGKPDAVPNGGGPTQEELNRAAGSTRDWLYHTHNYAGTRYAALSQIRAENAARLQVACVLQLGEVTNFQTGPIVYNGTMYVTTVSSTVAIDASNCQVKWRHKWEPRSRDVWRNNRGVAIKDGYVVRGTSDGYLLALNAASGELVWAVKAAESESGETFTMAPMLFEDLVLIGPAGSENGISGWVGAFRLKDGSPVWKFKTVPGASEANSPEWKNPKNIRLGGGAVWTPFSLDHEHGELFVAVTNPAPDLPAHLRPGDNRYTNSVVVLDVRTGKLIWHRQTVPNDSHDWDLTQVSPLFSAPVKGRASRLVATVGKDGILRTLDRDNREEVYRAEVTTIRNYDKPVTPEGVEACPGVLGGVEWNGPALHPSLNTLFVGAVDWCFQFWAADEVRYIPGRGYMGGTMQPAGKPTGRLSAIDASTGEVKWRYDSKRPLVSAVTATAGNLVFTGELTGDFLALDARSGDVLYRFSTGGAIGGGIITYEIAGRQFVAVMSGRPSPFWAFDNPGSPTVFLFALPR